ncbi:unnamed protein product [Adineta steineri]|uniref:Uncharacterized protein n=1 Tax=Adineta steineri TaxID=433720 RepID=A0A815VPL6_9BILA|nr:unnamed protein product [Adineta steineri]
MIWQTYGYRFMLCTLILSFGLIAWQMSEIRHNEKHHLSSIVSNDQLSDSSTFVAISVNTDIRYAYLLPFIAEGWQRCGVQPVMVLIEDESIWRKNNCTSVILDYLHKRKVLVRHLSSRSLIDKYTSRILSRTSRLAVPHILKKMGLPSNTVLWTGDADVIPLKCDYFRSIPRVMKERNVQVYMDGPYDMSIPRYLMCYISAYLSSWYNLTEEGASIEEVMEKTLSVENVQIAYNNPNRTKPGHGFDELFVGRRIKKLWCFPNCTTHSQPPVRDYNKENRGPGRPPFTWAEALGNNSQATLDFLGTLTEAHTGSQGTDPFYGKNAWPLLHGLIAIFMERDVVNRLSDFVTHFFQLNC